MVPLNLLLLAVPPLCLAFAAAWVLCRWLRNASFLPATWAFAFAPLACFYAWFGPGWFLRKFVVASIAVLWSVRLGSHLLKRALAEHPREDGRYARLRSDNPAGFDGRMLLRFQLYAASVALLSVPLLLPVFNPAVNFHRLEIAGVVLWFVGLYGEALADAQLASFRRDPANRGQVCTVGLWRYSRHPNYFFEWLVWIAFAVFALGSPHGWIGLIAPAIMLYVLVRGTGIPPTETQAVRSMGEGYRQYQQTTRAFVPWLPGKPRD